MAIICYYHPQSNDIAYPIKWKCLWTANKTQKQNRDYWWDILVHSGASNIYNFSLSPGSCVTVCNIGMKRSNRNDLRKHQRAETKKRNILYNTRSHCTPIWLAWIHFIFNNLSCGFFSLLFSYRDITTIFQLITPTWSSNVISA